MFRLYLKILLANILAGVLLTSLIIGSALLLGGCCNASIKQEAGSERVIGPKVSRGSVQDKEP